jgi:hypothetical protein
LYTDRDFELFFGNTDVADDIRGSPVFKLNNLIKELEICASDLCKAGLNEFVSPILEILIAIYKAQNDLRNLIRIHKMVAELALEVC